MADIPVEVQTTNDRIQTLETQILEIGRGVNLQARLLESIVVAFDQVVKTYVQIVTPKKEPVNAEKVKEPAEATQS